MRVKRFGDLKVGQRAKRSMWATEFDIKIENQVEHYPGLGTAIWNVIGEMYPILGHVSADELVLTDVPVIQRFLAGLVIIILLAIIFVGT
jgi:hypothetical protein